MTSMTPQPGTIIAAVDAGSNAIRFGIYKLDSRLHPMRVHQMRYPVRLGAGTFSTGALTNADMDAAIEAFLDIAGAANSKNASALLAVATSAVRDASNRDEFIDRVKLETGIDLQVIDGSREARLATLGIVSPIGELHNRLLIDVGGGSSELAMISSDGQLQWDISLPVGAVRLAHQWENQPMNSEEIAQEQKKLGERLNRLLESQTRTAGEIQLSAIATGGTANAVYNAVVHALHSPDEKKLSTKDVTKLLALLQTTTPGDYPTLLNIAPDRTPVIIPGAMILLELLQAFRLESLEITDAGVREGLVLDYIARQLRPAD